MLTSSDVLDCVRKVISPDILSSAVPRRSGIDMSQWSDLTDAVMRCVMKRAPGINLEISPADKDYWYGRPIGEFVERLVQAVDSAAGTKPEK